MRRSSEWMVAVGREGPLWCPRYGHFYIGPRNILKNVGWKDCLPFASISKWYPVTTQPYYRNYHHSSPSTTHPASVFLSPCFLHLPHPPWSSGEKGLLDQRRCHHHCHHCDHQTQGVGRIKSKFATNPGSDHRSTHYGHFSSVMVMMALISFDSQYRDLNLNITTPGSSSSIVLIFHHCHPPCFHLILTASQESDKSTVALPWGFPKLAFSLQRSTLRGKISYYEFLVGFVWNARTTN